MKAFISIKYHEDRRNEEIINRISHALEQRDIKTICIIRDVERWGELRYSSQDLMRITFKEIDTSDVIVLDLTEKGVGVGIEAGYAYANGKPIITIAKYGSEISETLKGISNSIFTYKSIEEITQILTQIHLQ